MVVSIFMFYFIFWFVRCIGGVSMSVWFLSEKLVFGAILRNKKKRKIHKKFKKFVPNLFAVFQMRLTILLISKFFGLTFSRDSWAVKSQSVEIHMQLFFWFTFVTSPFSLILFL